MSEGTICITVRTDKEGLDATMDERFGRAERFLLVDAQSGEVIELLPNESASEAHGAGIASAAAMGKHNVKAVISGRFGPKAFQALKGMDIEPWMAPYGISAKRAFELYGEGKLQQMEFKVYR